LGILSEGEHLQSGSDFFENLESVQNDIGESEDTFGDTYFLDGPASAEKMDGEIEEGEASL
jgi:hypothetical protein